MNVSYRDGPFQVHNCPLRVGADTNVILEKQDSFLSMSRSRVFMGDKRYLSHAFPWIKGQCCLGSRFSIHNRHTSEAVGVLKATTTAALSLHVLVDDFFFPSNQPPVEEGVTNCTW